MQSQWAQPSMTTSLLEGTAILLLFEVTICPWSLVQLELEATCQCLTGRRVTFLTATGEGIPQPHLCLTKLQDHGLRDSETVHLAEVSGQQAHTRRRQYHGA